MSGRFLLRRLVAAGMRAFALPVVFLVLTASVVRAHDVYSSWAETKLFADRMELTLTLARSCAHDLLADWKTLPPIAPENFADFAPRLRAIAPELFHVIADGKRLSVRSAAVALTDDNDITFTLVYPLPGPGTLRFAAQFLRHVPDGHVCTLVVTNAAGEDLGWSPVSVESPFFEVSLSSPKGPQRK